MKFIPETIGDRILVWVKETHGNQTKAAEALGMSKSLLNQIIKGHRKPVPRVLDAMGFERRVVYVKREQA